MNLWYDPSVTDTVLRLFLLSVVFLGGEIANMQKDEVLWNRIKGLNLVTVETPSENFKFKEK